MTETDEERAARERAERVARHRADLDAAGICPDCTTARSASGACACDVDGVPPGVSDARTDLDRLVRERRAVRVYVTRKPGPARSRSTSGCACGEPTRDGAYVCARCVDQLVSDLHRVPAAVADLADARYWSTVKAIDYSRIGAKSGSEAVHPMPINLAATVSRDKLRELLRSLVEECLVHRIPSPHPGRPTVPMRDDLAGMAAWLRERADDMALHPAFASTPANLSYALEWVTYVTTPRPLMTHLGECPLTGCPGTMWAERDAVYAWCDTCQGAVDARALRDGLLAELDARWVTAAEAATLLVYLRPHYRHQVHDRIRQWATRGHLAGACPWPSDHEHEDAVVTGGDPAAVVEPARYQFDAVYRVLLTHESRHRHAWSSWVEHDDGTRTRRCEMSGCEAVETKGRARQRSGRMTA